MRISRNRPAQVFWNRSPIQKDKFQNLIHEEMLHKAAKMMDVGTEALRRKRLKRKDEFNSDDVLVLKETSSAAAVFVTEKRVKKAFGENRLVVADRVF